MARTIRHTLDKSATRKARRAERDRRTARREQRAA